MKKALILLVIFLTACQGGKKVNPNSSGAVNIIRVSDLQKSQKEQPAMNILPNGGVVPHKPNVTSKELPIPAPAPPTVQRNKVDIVIREPENGPAVPMIVTKPMTALEKADAWIYDHGALISYYSVAFTGFLMLWLLWTINNQKRALNLKTAKQAIKPKKRASTKRPAKKAAKKTTAKKAVKKTAKKKASKKKS